MRMRGSEHGLHVAGRAAGIQLPTRPMIGYQRIEVGTRAFVLEVQHHAVVPRRRLQVVDEARGAPARGAVVELEGLVATMQDPRHRDQRRHADAAGKQEGTGGPGQQRKMVAWSGHEHTTALAERAMHQHRAAPPCRLPLHAERPAARVGRVARQAVLTLVLRRDHDVDVCARIEGRQLAPVGCTELVARDVGGDIDPPAQHHRKHRRVALGHAKRWRKPLGLPGSQATTVFGRREQRAVARDALLPVDRESDRIGRRHPIGWVHRERLVLVAQLQAGGQPACMRMSGSHVAPAAAIEFDVPPPLLDRIDLSAAQTVVQRGQPSRLSRKPHRDPAECRFREQAFEVPGAGLHAPPAHAAAGIGDPVTRALLGIGLPDLVAVVHQLGARGDRARRALARALVAGFAESLQAEVDRAVEHHRHVGGDGTGLQPGAQVGVEDHLPDTADFTQARQQQQRRLQYLAVEHRVHTGRVAEPADLLGDHAAEHREPQVRPHALRHRDPVVAARAFHGLVTLIVEHADRMGVIRHQFHALRIVRIPGPIRDRAKADRIATEEVARGLQVVRVALRIVATGRNGSARITELQQQQRTQRPARARPDRALHHIVRVLALLLHVLAHVAAQHPREEIRPLRKPRHARVIDEGGRHLAPAQRLERIRAESIFAPRIGIARRRTLDRAVTGPPGRTMRAQAIGGALRRQGLIVLEHHRSRDRGEPEPASEVRIPKRSVAELPYAGGEREAPQVDIRAGGRVRTRGEAQHAQIRGEQHRRLRRQQGGTLRLRILDPVASGFVGPGVAQILHRDDDRVIVMVDRIVAQAGGIEHIGIDHVHARRQVLRLTTLEFVRQVRDHRVADRIGQSRLGRHPAGRGLGGVEIVGGRLKVATPLGRIRRDLGLERIDRTVAHHIEHADVARHRMHQRRRIGRLERQRAHRRQCRQVRQLLPAPQALLWIRTQVDRS